MTDKPRKSGGDLFIVDNADDRWKVQRYLHDWCDVARAFDIATGYFEIGALLALDSKWQQLETSSHVQTQFPARRLPDRNDRLH